MTRPARLITRVTYASVIVLGVILLGYAGVMVGYHYGRNELCCNLWRRENVRISLLELVGARRYYGQTSQDRLIIVSLFPTKTDGFFADIGSADGVTDSNSKAFEDRGWKGVCVDPFPRNMKSRTCKLFEEPVDVEAGRLVDFRVGGFLGGIDEYLGRWKDRVKDAQVVTLKTTTLTDIFDRASAPSRIDFMSLDIEGAELPALQGLSFEKYRPSVIALEHNYEEPKRSEIREFLGSKGYVVLASLLQDDIYVHSDVKLNILGD